MRLTEDCLSGRPSLLTTFLDKTLNCAPMSSSSWPTCRPGTRSARTSLHEDCFSWFHSPLLMRYAPLHRVYFLTMSLCLPPLCLLFSVSSFWICTLLLGDQLSSISCTSCQSANCHFWAIFLLGVWHHSMYTLFAASVRWLSAAVASVSTFSCLLWLHQLPWGYDLPCLSVDGWPVRSLYIGLSAFVGQY